MCAYSFCVENTLSSTQMKFIEFANKAKHNIHNTEK